MTNKQKELLDKYGWTYGLRDPRLNMNYCGRFMVVEPHDESELPTLDGRNGPWCIVGDNLDDLISRAYSALASMV